MLTIQVGEFKYQLGQYITNYVWNMFLTKKSSISLVSINITSKVVKTKDNPYNYVNFVYVF